MGQNPGVSIKFRDDCCESSTLMAVQALFELPFSLQMRLPLPGLFRGPGCDAAGPGNQARHA